MKEGEEEEQEQEEEEKDKDEGWSEMKDEHQGSDLTARQCHQIRTNINSHLGTDAGC